MARDLSLRACQRVDTRPGTLFRLITSSRRPAGSRHFCRHTTLGLIAIAAGLHLRDSLAHIDFSAYIIVKCFNFEARPSHHLFFPLHYLSRHLIASPSRASERYTLLGHAHTDYYECHENAAIYRVACSRIGFRLCRSHFDAIYHLMTAMRRI